MTGQVQKLFTSTRNLFDFRRGGCFYYLVHLTFARFTYIQPASRYISHFLYYRSSNHSFTAAVYKLLTGFQQISVVDNV